MTATLDQNTTTEAERTDATGTPVFDTMVERLSRQSVEKHFDAYGDVDWDSPEFAIDPTDPRWFLWDLDPLGATDWYRAQPDDVRARIGLHRVAVGMRTGWEFENVLQRGLLGYAYRLDNGRPEFRYLHHEVIEESQHTMMFQEFINRSGVPVTGLPRPMKFVAETFVIPLNHLFPELFFLFVLGGEDPIDHVQRQRLRDDHGHPLVQRIMRIHVTEEARHLSFARHYLKANVPALGFVRRQILGIATPLLLGVMARQMLYPTPAFAKANNIPRAAIRESKRSQASRDLICDSVAKVRRLSNEIGLINPVTRSIWRLLGIWDDPNRGAAQPS
jgi:hypothetical protein